ncbi:MAG: phage Gp37/Gp68 family protein [Blastomonas sp.]
MPVTTIEWTEATWNPIAGCTVHSPGCTNCYAMRTAARLANIPATAPVYAGLTQPSKAGPVWTGKVAVNESTMLAPLRRRKPTMYFVNSMSDLFHEAVPDEVIDRVFAVMALCPQHTFQVLTKRSERMRAYLTTGRSIYVWRQTRELGLPELERAKRLDSAVRRRVFLPLANVWLGVSVEDQKRADERIPDLLATPAAVRFLSCEPLLGPVSLEEAWHGESALDSECWGECGWCVKGYPPLHNCRDNRQSEADWMKGRSGIDWVIVGGESGPGARPMHPQWARSLRDQCAAAGVPFFFKQWGEWKALSGPDGFWPHNTSHHCRLMTDGTRHPRGWSMQRVGKKAAGRTLDGVTHDAMPQVQAHV